MGDPMRAAGAVLAPETRSPRMGEVTSGLSRFLEFFMPTPSHPGGRFHCYGMATVLPPVGAVKRV